MLNKNKDILNEYQKNKFQVKIDIRDLEVVTYNKKNTLAVYIIIMKLNATNNRTIICIKLKLTEL